MAKTYQTIYENEVRPIKLEITDQYEDTYTPDNAYAAIYNEKTGAEVVSEAAVMVTDNVIYAIVDTTLTETPGNYYILWRILKTDAGVEYTFYHKTHLIVEEL